MTRRKPVRPAAPNTPPEPWADKFREHGNGVFLGPIANARWTTDLLRSSTVVWFCRDFAFTHPTHAGKRSSMPLMFVAIGPRGAGALRRLAREDRHPGVLMETCP